MLALCCVQCNICAFVCPHAAIRPVLATPEELGSAPAGFDTLPIKGSKELSQYQYRMQVSPQDCTGCELCVHVCPDEALTATPILDVLAPETANWDFMQTIPNRGNLFDKSTVSPTGWRPTPHCLWSGMRHLGACRCCAALRRCCWAGRVLTHKLPLHVCPLAGARQPVPAAPDGVQRRLRGLRRDTLRQA